LAETLLRAVSAAGYSVPTPIQSRAIPHVLAGRDVLACAQTGTGKTAAFALPLLDRLLGRGGDSGRRRRPRVLVLAPTRELAAQIGECFRVYGRDSGLRQVVVFGGVGQAPQVRALQQGVDIVVATPGRLLDLIGQRVVDLGAVECLVLDEADRMLDMGFIPDVRRILGHLPQKRQTVLFSATMPPQVEQLAAAILHRPTRVRVAPVAATAELIEQSVCFAARASKPRVLAQFLRAESFTRALVFTRTKRGADRVARQLRQVGIAADAIHGNKSQSARQRTLADFKSSRTPVLVATDIAARGIDVEGISHVLNYDLPHEPETYVHRIGRTGRAGAAGAAVSLCDPEERGHLEAIERLLGRRLPVVPRGDGGGGRGEGATQARSGHGGSSPQPRPRRGSPIGGQQHRRSTPGRRKTPARISLN
jgi:ATP-dependent RNA helicase RhlE